MTTRPTPMPFLENLDTYIPGKNKVAGISNIIKLSSNENPNGASPKALEAYAAAAAKLHRYPEDGALALREAIGKLHGFAPEQIICGTGSDDVIRMLCAAYSGAGREVIYTEHGFAMYRIYAQQCGATAIAAPEKNLRTDVDAILATVSERTSLVFIANPNNPTGSYIDKDELHRLRTGLREDIILVLDGAYAEYMTAPDFTDGRELCETSNTVIMRTFSKAYGLPTLRIGWGYGPRDIIDMLYKVRSPFNITQPTIDAAIAAVQDQDYLNAHIAQNNAERARLCNAFEALDLKVHPSFANFVLVEFASGKAADTNTFLSQKGIIVREVANYGLPNCLRITIGTPAENDALLAALAEWKSQS